jgi:hypothetical protein
VLCERCEGAERQGGSFIAERGLEWTRWVVAVVNPRIRADIRAVRADEGGQTSAWREFWSKLRLGLVGLDCFGPPVHDVVSPSDRAHGEHGHAMILVARCR